MPARPSIAEELASGTSDLQNAGVLNPRREALAVWASLAGVQMGDVWMARDTIPSESMKTRFREAVERRRLGEPFAYVVGSAGFRKLELKVDRRVLIPRPETEGLVERVLDWARGREKSEATTWGTAADVGTGSGNIALSLALEGNFDRIIATDISAESLELAGESAKAAGLDTSVEFRQGSLLGPLDGVTADVIVSNPPYVSETEYSKLNPGVRDFEPRDALVSGSKGMAHTKELLEGAQSFLIPGGLIAIEVDSTRADLALGIARHCGWTEPSVEADLFGSPRYLFATKEL